MRNVSQLILIDQIEPMIHDMRCKKVVIASDLAALYGASTKRLIEQVKRNASRFPTDFMFQLTAEEKAEVVASLLNSPRATGKRLWLS